MHHLRTKQLTGIIIAFLTSMQCYAGQSASPEMESPLFYEELFLNYRSEPITERGVRRLVAEYGAKSRPDQEGEPAHAAAHLRRGQAPPRRAAAPDPGLAGAQEHRPAQTYTHLDRQDAHKAMEATSL